MSYPVEPATWVTLGAPLSIGEGDVVGRALLAIGTFDEARPRFERAVAEAAQGDEFGRINRERLATIIRAAADCLRKLGLEDLARGYEERVRTTFAG